MHPLIILKALQQFGGHLRWMARKIQSKDRKIDRQKVVVPGDISSAALVSRRFDCPNSRVVLKNVGVLTKLARIIDVIRAMVEKLK